MYSSYYTIARSFFASMLNWSRYLFTFW